MNWQQYGHTILDSRLSKNVPGIWQSHKIYQRNHDKQESGIDSRRKNFSRGENPVKHLPGRCTFPITICNGNDATQLYTQEVHRGLQVYKIPWKNNHLMYKDVIRLFVKNVKELKILIQTIKIYCQDTGMEFYIEKCAMLLMKSGKRQITEGIEVPNQERTKLLGEKEKHKHQEVFEVDTIKQVKKKKNKEKRSSDKWKKFLKPSSAAEILLKE